MPTGISLASNAFEAEAFDQILEPKFGDPSPDRRVLHTLAQNGNVLDKLQRYAAAAERSYYKALRELQNLRSRTKQDKAANKAASDRAWLAEQLANTSVPDDLWMSDAGLLPMQNEPDPALPHLDDTAPRT